MSSTLAAVHAASQREADLPASCNSRWYRPRHLAGRGGLSAWPASWRSARAFWSNRVAVNVL